MTDRTWSRRDFIRRATVAGAVALGGPALLSACTAAAPPGGGGGGGGNVLDNARSSGSIRIGIAGEQPYGFTTPDGETTGEAPEVARAVLQALGIAEVQATQVPEFSALIPSLNAGNYDMVCAGMNITAERCGQAAFSIPDYSARTAFLVPTGNPEGVATFEDVAAKNLGIAVLSAAVEQGFAESAGVPAGNVQAVADQNALLQAVTDGRVYCGALTDISLKWLTGTLNPDAPVEVTEGFDPVVDGEPVVSAGGFVFRQADTELREAFDTELRNLQQSGRWVEIATPFGFSEANLPAAGLTTEQLCSA